MKVHQTCSRLSSVEQVTFIKVRDGSLNGRGIKGGCAAPAIVINIVIVVGIMVTVVKIMVIK